MDEPPSAPRAAGARRIAAGSGTVRREYPAEPATIVAARRLVAERLGEGAMRPERRDDLLLAVSEAVTNAVRHAYTGAGGVVELAVTCAAGAIVVTVSDYGRGLDRPSANPGLGLGLDLIRQVCDEVDLRDRVDGGTSVEMRFSLDGHGRRNEQ